jgi:uncharacterized membrane protein (DUF2068 family)
MSRHLLIAAVALPHMLAAGILVTRMAVVALATRSPEVGAAAARTIWLQTAVLTVPALLLLIGIVGLWLRRHWGWQFTLAGDLILISLVAVDWLVGGQRVDHAPVLVVLAALAAPLLVPRIRTSLTASTSREAASQKVAAP